MLLLWFNLPKKKKIELDIAKEILFCGGFAKGC